jgi:hypothetical protein
MSPAAIVSESQPLVLHLGSFLEKMSDREFFTFCQLNPKWRLERASAGDLGDFRKRCSQPAGVNLPPAGGGKVGGCLASRAVPPSNLPPLGGDETRDILFKKSP